MFYIYDNNDNICCATSPFPPLILSVGYNVATLCEITREFKLMGCSRCWWDKIMTLVPLNTLKVNLLSIHFTGLNSSKLASTLFCCLFSLNSASASFFHSLHVSLCSCFSYQSSFEQPPGQELLHLINLLVSQSFGCLHCPEASEGMLVKVALVLSCVWIVMFKHEF